MPPRRIVDQINDTDEPEDDREPIDEGEEELEAGADDEDEVEETEPEDDDETQDDGQEPEPEPEPRTRRAPGRREAAVVQARRRAQVAEEQLRERELEIARLRGSPQPQDQRESAAVRAARLAAMDPVERVEFRLDEERQERQRERANDAFRNHDISDRQTFRALGETNPSAKKYEAEVEHRLQLLRASGQNAPRESILKFLLGERVLTARKSPKAQAQRDAAERRVERQSVTLPRGKGERGSRAGSKSADLEKRLLNVPI